jgi:hypothetical protein
MAKMTEESFKEKLKKESGFLSIGKRFPTEENAKILLDQLAKKKEELKNREKAAN